MKNSLQSPVFFYRRGELYVESVPVRKIAGEFGTPAYVYSLQAIRSRFLALHEALQGTYATICYAVKSNSNLSILRALSRLGAGMDIVSGGELFRVGKIGVAGSRIVFSGVGKTPDEMLQALKYKKTGIFSFNVESIEELRLLNDVAGRLGRTARVALRFNPDVDAKTHPYIATGLEKNKFGLSRAEVREVARAAKNLKNLNFLGLSIHIGSQLLSLEPLDEAFSKLREMSSELDKKLPQPLEYLDLGGGVGISYQGEKAPSIASYGALIRKHFARNNSKRLFLEPGRLITGNSGALITRVLYRKKRGSREFVIIDGAMNDLLRPALYGSHHEIVPVQKKRPMEKLRSVEIVGPVCETADFLGKNRKIPETLRSGDELAILDAGAYGFSMSGNYNSRPRACEVLVSGRRCDLIRKRETFADLIQGEK